MTVILWILFIAILAGALYRCHRLHRESADTQSALQSAHTRIQQYKENEIIHQRTTEKLRSYLHLMDVLINTIPNPIYFKDEDGIFQGCNKMFAKQILGLTRADIIGQRAQSMPDQIPSELAARYQREERKMAEKGREHNYESAFQCADGRQRDFLFSIAPVLDDAGQLSGSVAIMSDLTDKNRAAQDRMEKEKLQGVLETAGGVCHEFNQPLQALSGYAELMAAKLSPDDPATALLRKMETQIKRLQSITDNLQGITRYETTPYAGSVRIIDIEKSSEDG